MQRVTFTNRPLGYSSICLTLLFTALSATLIAYLGTSWALASEADRASSVTVASYQHKPVLLSALTTSHSTETANPLNAVVGGGAASVGLSEANTPKSAIPFNALPYSRVPALSSLKEDAILSPFDTARGAAFNTPSVSKVTEPLSESAAATKVQPVSSLKETTTGQQALSSLVNDRELQRQRAVVQFLIARPGVLQVVTPKNQSMVLKSIEYKTTRRASFYINQTEVFQFRSSLGFLTPFLRSKQAAHRLHLFLKNNGNYNDIQLVASEAGMLLKMGEMTLATVDAETAQSLGLSVDALANTWKQRLRSALGETTAAATPPWVKKPLQQSSRLIAQGLASWYGPGFHGRLAADGSRFNQNALTAAHKTLPFGTKLLVTNQRTGKSCVVKVTDRGPFVGHRVIDLSKGAAAAIGMLGSGVGKVSLHLLR